MHVLQIFKVIYIGFFGMFVGVIKLFFFTTIYIFLTLKH